MSAVLGGLRRILLLVLLLTIGGLAAGELRPVVRPVAAAAAVRVPRLSSPRQSEASLDSIIEGIRLAAPFQPTRIPVSPVAPPSVTASGAPQPRPALVLTAIAGGRVPAVVLEGLPGVEGSRVVRVGDTAAGIRIQAIGARGATVVGYDTTWFLSLKEPP